MSLLSANPSFESPRNKVVLILGASGTGKSKLSIDLATHFPAEIINSDKLQVYKGLDITTNKVTQAEQSHVPHHLLGHVTDPEADYTAEDFALDVLSAIEAILTAGRVPIIAGGSNSYIEALVEDPAYQFKERFESLFIWLDVAKPVLDLYVAKRVDDMVRQGVVEEVRGLFDPDADYTKGIRRAIGVPELDRYFKEEPELDEKEKERVLEKAIKETKENTCKLTARQVGKILRLRDERGWKLHRIDATAVFEKSGKEALEEWEALIMQPCLEIVEEFLRGPDSKGEAVDHFFNACSYPGEVKVISN
ncbi:hypothetical protein Nepgr_004583 [Nepenthes gracilis]|uniref:adenylate dimethylallyltransferase (ADP/ATP-dependent) n=1 Tax=Nepenthes gracilis TaxID=150966 RepID=A0AAD3XFA6_NEPGR|nr:hypothetical protein Nepgr_004583 [Nepenthes gracilis]